MTREATLRSLECLLEGFLERVIALKKERLGVLTEINRLDDVAASPLPGDNALEPVADWFAKNNRLLAEDRLRPGDLTRIDQMLGEITKSIDTRDDTSPEATKIRSEIGRWTKAREQSAGRLILRRGPEIKADTAEDSIMSFGKTLARVSGLYLNLSDSKQHLLSVLDNALNSASQQKNTEALLLSACVIYYLKQRGYKVEPYVERLRKTEKLLKEGEPGA